MIDFLPTRGWETVHQRFFRDRLLEHPGDRRRHEALKRSAAAAALEGTSSYNAAKTGFVQEIVDAARGRLGLQPVSVDHK